MKELQEIVNAFGNAKKQGKQTALATVVLVEGSSYRRAGARMLLTEDGQLTGAISGGCLEGDALRKARLVITQNKPMLVTYDTMDDDDAKFGVGLGCNGIIHILIEPLSENESRNPIELFRQFLANREPVVFITLFSLKNKKGDQPGTCLLISSDKKVSGNLADNILLETLLEEAEFAFKSGISNVKNYDFDQEYTCFIELVQPVISLVVFGAGNDAIPLLNFAAVLGWEVTLVDGRANYASIGRFPTVKQIIIAKPENALEDIILDSRTAIVLMTHNYNYDLGILKQLLSKDLPYIASLGPKKRLIRMLDELAEEGMDLGEGKIDNIYGPAGLDIGSENADEIALSIIAEIQAVFKGRDGASLRNKPANNQHIYIDESRSLNSAEENSFDLSCPV